MKKKTFIINIFIIIIIAVSIILLVITFLKKGGSMQNSENNVPFSSLDTPVEIKEYASENNEPHKKNIEPLNMIQNTQNEVHDHNPRVVLTGTDMSTPEGVKKTLKQLRYIADSSAGFSEEAIKSMNSGDPLSINGLPDELQPVIKKALEKNKKNGYDEVDDKYAEGIVNITNYLVDTSSLISNIRFTPSKIPDLINFNYNYMGYSFPSTSALGIANLGIQGTVRRVYQKLDKSHILIVQESTLQSGSSNIIKEFVNEQVFGYSAIYAIKKPPSGKTFATLTWTAKDFSFTLYQINSVENAQQILREIGTSLTQINAKKETLTKEADIIPVEESPKVDLPF